MGAIRAGILALALLGAGCAQTGGPFGAAPTTAGGSAEASPDAAGGVFGTPAVVVDGEVKIAGKVATKNEIKKLLSE